jgi:hypothetical protein
MRIFLLPASFSIVGYAFTYDECNRIVKLASKKKKPYLQGYGTG